MILIADDFESEIALLSGILSELGFTDFIVAHDGAEAIQALESGAAFETVITDYNMPFRNGGEVVDRALELGVKKILLRSSHSVVTLRTKLAEIGVNDLECVEIICKKDFDATELKIYLNEFLS
jgi:CheY-like chemotaxis protein